MTDAHEDATISDAHEDLTGLEQRLRATAPRVAAAPPDPAPGAHTAGLLDVAYATLATAVGELLLAATPRGLVRLAYLDHEPQAVLENLARRVSPRVLEAPRALDEPRRQLEQYLDGRRTAFELRLDWQLAGGPFAQRVLRATAQVPFGEVTSYKGVAGAAGSPRAFRAAGNALGANPLPIVVPCHRVLTSSGGLGGYTGGLERKLTLLRLEGVVGPGGG